MQPQSNTHNSLPTTQKPSIPSVPLAIAQRQLQVTDIIAPNTLEVDFSYVKINDVYFRTLYMGGFPRFVAPGWLESIVNFDSSLDISFYIYPVDAKTVLDDLRRKITEMEAEIATDIERGKIVDPSTQAKLEDARSLQEQLVKGAERFFQFSFYITIPAKSVEELDHITRQVESTLGALLIIGKKALLDMENGFLSTIPFGFDRLAVTRNMDTTSLATTFPLTSAELSSDRGVMYGTNSQNESFIIFDRFSLENANFILLGTSGGGKSVSYDCEVLYQDVDGKTKKDKIGKFVEDKFKDADVQKLARGIEGVINPGIKVYSFNKNLGGVWSKVSIAARKTSPRYLYKITTASGREAEITADHCLVVLKDAKIQTRKGDQIGIGDHVPLPRMIRTKSQNKEVKTINCLELLSGSPIKFLRHRKGRIGNRLISRGSIPEKIELSPGFFQFLGIFAAEGMARYKRVLISSTTHEVITQVSNYYNSLGIKYNLVKKDQKNIGINVYLEVFMHLLRSIGASGKAGEKRVSPLIFDSGKSNISTFLSGYFEGDGGVEHHKISATTKSKGLASDISYLLFCLGIIARTKKVVKSAVNTKIKKKRGYYRITISGQDNLRKFIDQIGFITKEKNTKAKALLKSSNTNVDLIPELESIFKEIHQELYSSTEIPAPKKFSEIKLGIFRPSPQNLISIVNKVEKRIEEIEALETDGLSILNSLPTINEIKDVAKAKGVNFHLWRALGHSWQTMRAGRKSYLENSLVAAQVTHQIEYSNADVCAALYRTFRTTGQSLGDYNNSLRISVVRGRKNPTYESVILARDYIFKKYQQKKIKLEQIKERVSWLKKLATSELFWDPIVEIKKIKARHKYVYDLQVENAVFLAGFGGVFVHNSFFVKLEAVRSLMIGTDVIVIDPEAEYKALAEAAGGEFISFSYNSPSKINPFDLSQIYEEGENQLGLKILSLHSLFKVIMGQITPSQEALLDQSLVATYRGKGITQDPATQKKEAPLMEDLYKALIGMETKDALDLAARLEKFVKGSFVGIFDQQTNIDIRNPFTVFSVKDLQDVLRPIAMFIILDFIWTKVKKDLKKRILIVDEAWHMMKYPDSAQFLWSVVKRARKYFLGLTTITQDVEDFLGQDIGKAILTNSSMQLLLKQSPAAIDKIVETFYLSQGEKLLLLAANVGEGIFFAGPHHAPIRVVASQEEHKLITTKPQEMAEFALNQK